MSLLFISCVVHVFRSDLCIYSKLVAINMIIISIGTVKTVSDALVLGGLFN